MENKKAFFRIGALTAEKQQVSEYGFIQRYFAPGLVALAIIYTLACLFLAKPLMPRFGLDPSWALGVNWAVANGLKIGQDIVFTVGPYASSYTEAYDPSTDYLRVGSALFLTLCFGLVFLYLAGRHRLHVTCLLTAAIIAFPYSNDALFLLYPLLVAFCVRKYVFFEQQSPNWKRLTGLILMASLSAPLGFLPLVKGSFALSCVATGITVVCYLVYSRRRLAALVVVLVPVITAVLAWIEAGQQLKGLPKYFLSMASIISGYTEAMSLEFDSAVAFGLPATEIFLYSFIAFVLLVILFKNLENDIGDKIFCLIVSLLYLFIIFKAGFTRHDGHAVTAVCGLLFFAVTIGFISEFRGWIACLVLALIFVGFFAIGNDQEKRLMSDLVPNIKNNYRDGWIGVSARLDASAPLDKEFATRFKEMKSRQSLPLLAGSSDIYSYDQVMLLASGNKWNPRPVFQSYSAYTKNLAEKNAAHLRDLNAPENIFFKPQAIDGRFAPLEDGISWAAFFDNYDVVDLVDDFTILHKKEVLLPVSSWLNKSEKNFNISEIVELPRTGLPIYVTLQVRPTFLGHILTVLFKPPPLSLELNLNDGRQENYRVVAGMMESGFFISPRVITSKEFYLLQTGNTRYMSNATVASFKINRPIGGALFWHPAIRATIAEYQPRPALPVPEDFFDSIFKDNLSGLVVKTGEGCDGAIDTINDVAAGDSASAGGSFFSVNGWLAESAKNGTVPEKVFVALTGNDGKVWYAAARSMPRDDVKSHLKHPNMPDVGFSLTADASKLNGHYSVGLVKFGQGQAVMCQFKKSITISQQ